MTNEASIRQEKLKNIFSGDNFSKYCGMEVLEATPGYSKIRMKIRDDHLNFFGTVHGGAIFALGDSALGAAANAYGTLSVAVSCNIQYMKSGVSGYLTAEAEEISLNHSLATYLIHIYDDDEDEVATFQGMVYRKKKDILDMLEKENHPTTV